MNVEELKIITLFQNVPMEECEWFADHCTLVEFEIGDLITEQGSKADALTLLLEGQANIVRQDKGKEVAAFLAEEGSIGGILPFSRMEQTAASIYAITACKQAYFSATLFPKLHDHAPTILQRLVNEMVDRTRSFTQLGAQRDKLISLGTMSAGLAHELNNPASAAKRAAQNLKETLQAFDEHSSSILAPVLFKEHSENDPFKAVYKSMTLDGEHLSTLERSDREDELADWLESHGLDDAWDVAAILVSGGVTVDAMQQVAEKLRPEQIMNFLNWVPKDVEMRLLAKELIESTSRISDLVSAMKSYTYMDRDQAKQAIDLHEGIINTIIILKHKFTKKGISVIKDFAEIPQVNAYGSELNQVWTNLLSNAVDALDEGGKITIKTRLDASVDVVIIDVIDNGSGIPKELQDRIFEPFYTTKGVGEGTGMGLDIVNRIIRQRHRGSIQLNSTEGYTCFRVRLPIS